MCVRPLFQFLVMPSLMNRSRGTFMCANLVLWSVGMGSITRQYIIKIEEEKALYFFVKKRNHPPKLSKAYKNTVLHHPHLSPHSVFVSPILSRSLGDKMFHLDMEIGKNIEPGVHLSLTTI